MRESPVYIPFNLGEIKLLEEKLREAQELRLRLVELGGHL